MKPLVKWAGGKRQLIPALVKYLPVSWNRYFEPFSGGLALLVELHNRGMLAEAVIGDTNPELINLYFTVKKLPANLVSAISGLNIRNEAQFYYGIRERFNSLLGDGNSAVERAAMFLYLNRHGYNGLWRVNSKGEFNVPFGRYGNPSLPSAEHVYQFSEMLRGVDILLGDFSSVIESAKKGDFVYFDPPYFPLSKSSSFTHYSRDGFGYSDQSRLLELCRKLHVTGVRFLLSNSYSKEMTDLFSEFNVARVEASRFINSAADRRTGHYEILVTNYEIDPNEYQEGAECPKSGHMNNTLPAADGT